MQLNKLRPSPEDPIGPTLKTPSERLQRGVWAGGQACLQSRSSIQGHTMRLAATLALAIVLPVQAFAQERPSLVFFGNVGTRAEYMANENFASTPTVAQDNYRVRFRVRVRFGARYQLAESVSTGFRLSTGSSDFPSSAWSSMNDVFRRDLIQLDRAFIRFQPRDQIELRFGLDDNAAFRASELVWDNDVSPAGLTQIFNVGQLRIVTGQYMLREVRTSRPDNREAAFLFINGASVVHGPLQVGVSHYYYNRPDAIATAIDDGELNGEFRTNRFDPADPAAYFSDFSTLQFAARATKDKWRISAEVAINLGAESNSALGPGFEDKENLAAGTLIRYGDHSVPWGWSVEAGYFQIQADAVIAVFNSDDFQQTNVHTVPVWFRFRLPSGAALVWDTYIQRKVNVNLASNGGVVHNENATKVRTRITAQVNF